MIGSWQNGHKAAWIAAEYAIWFSTVKRSITRYKRLGHSRASVQKRQAGQLGAEQLAMLAVQVREHDDATVDGHTDLWNERAHRPGPQGT